MTVRMRSAAVPGSRLLQSWMRSRRGSVSVEFVVGAVVIVVATIGGLDLYRVINTQSVGLRAATTMAEYVSLETQPQQAFLNDLAEFSYLYQIALPSEAAFVVSAVSRSDATPAEPDPPALVLWDRKFAVGQDPLSPPTELRDSCGQLDDPNVAGAALPPELQMEPGEGVVVVEVCVKLLPDAFLSGAVLPDLVLPTLLYQQQILPMRGNTVLQEPS